MKYYKDNQPIEICNMKCYVDMLFDHKFFKNRSVMPLIDPQKSIL